MKGTIKQVVRNKGYAFVRGTDGHSRFFHARDMEPPHAYETIEQGDAVTFNPSGELNGSPHASNNGLRARNVRVCAS